MKLLLKFRIKVFLNKFVYVDIIILTYASQQNKFTSIYDYFNTKISKLLLHMYVKKFF